MADDFQTPGQKFFASVLRTGAAATESVTREERRLVIQAIVVGVVVWGVVTLLKNVTHAGFHYLVEAMDRAPSVLLVAIPLVVGALIVATIAQAGGGYVYYRDKDGKLHELNAVEGDGLERAIGLYFASEPSSERALLGDEGVQARWKLPTFQLAAQKFLATLVTLTTGGSGGLEASVTLIGESTAAGLFKPRGLFEMKSRPLRLIERVTQWWQSARPEDLRAAQLCGIAAAFSTLLTTPFAAAFFAVEVMYRRRPIVDKLIYALISALVAFFLAHMFGAESPFHAERAALPHLYDMTYYVALFAVAVSIAVVGVVFGKARNALDHVFHARMPNPWARHVVGALGAATAAFGAAIALQWSGTADAVLGEHGGPGAIVSLVLGSGEPVIEAALLGELTVTVAVIALVAKMLATLATITSGGSAGLLFPTMVFGTTVAVAWSGVFGFEDPVVLIAPALTASLVSIVNVPLAAIFVVVELFGADWIVPSLFMLVTASIITHENSIYRTQHENRGEQEIYPGVIVRHVDIPPAYDGKTLRELDLRNETGVSVVGIVARADPGEIESEVELNPNADRPLREGDRLIIIADDDVLERWMTVEESAVEGE